MQFHYIIARQGINMVVKKKPNSSEGGDGKPRVLKRQPGCLNFIRVARLF
jgi:hypothetical protein